MHDGDIMLIRLEVMYRGCEQVIDTQFIMSHGQLDHLAVQYLVIKDCTDGFVTVATFRSKEGRAKNWLFLSPHRWSIHQAKVQH